MRSCKHKIGVTLVEMLIVLAVITLLTSMVVGIAARLDNQGKERLTENTLALLNAALGQFQDYEYHYKYEDYYEFEFPLDCNGFTAPELVSELEKALGLPGKMSIIGGVHHDPNYSGSEALYFFLSRVPTSRETLDSIDSSLIADEGSDNQDMKIRVNGKEYPLLRIIDPWDETLRYDYYNENAGTFKKMEESKRNFPVITSAGPDKIFGTADDITNR